MYGRNIPQDGVVGGGMAVLEAESLLGCSWRAFDPEGRYYRRRFVFYTYITATQKNTGVNGKEIAQRLDALRAIKKMTLSQFAEYLRTSVKKTECDITKYVIPQLTICIPVINNARFILLLYK